MTNINPAAQQMLADLERENAEAAASLIEIGGGATVVGKLMQAFRPIDFENAIEAIAEDKSITPEAIIVGVCWWMAMLSISIIARGREAGPRIAQILKDRYAADLDKAMEMPQRFYLLGTNGNVQEVTLRGLMRKPD